MTDRADADRSDWSWLQGTYWYVPPRSLPALQLDPDGGTLAWVVDQTVWHITGYRGGYFWGVSATQLRSPAQEAPPSGPSSGPVCFTMLGTITPEGAIHLTFVPAADSRSATIGIGTAVRHGAGFGLEMQMSSGRDVRTAHWAYMTAVRPDDPEWDSLPGVGISVPEMLEGCAPPRLAP